MHLAALRHPCVGDLTYGADPTLAAPARAAPGSGCTRPGSASRTRPTAGGSSSTSPYPADLAHALALVARLRPGDGVRPGGAVTAVAEGATLAGPPRVLAVLLVGYLVLVQPVVGAWSHHRFRAATDPGARLRRYWRTAALEWALVAVSLALVAGAPRGWTSATSGSAGRGRRRTRWSGRSACC